MGSRWSHERAFRELEDWAADIRSILAPVDGKRPSFVLLTGDYAQLGASKRVAQIIAVPALAVFALCERTQLACEVLEPESISRGAALFASRRARGWATYCDQLHSVEVVAQTPAGAAWRTLLDGAFYDAGAPIVKTLDSCSLDAGATCVRLPVYVDEYGPDTPNVLMTQVDFQQATIERADAKIVVEVEAATGLPVVRATIHSGVDQSAEVDWANPGEHAFTGLRKAEFLATLPRAFPPIEERSSARWWVSGAKYKMIRLPAPDGKEYTGETLSLRLVTLFSSVEVLFAPALKGFARLAAKKEWDPAREKWIAPTDAEGLNGASATLDNARETLFKAVFRQWKQASLSNTAGRALAALCWREQKWIDHLMQECAKIGSSNETSYVIAGLGACVYREEDMARAIDALARRLRGKVRIAKNSHSQPVGIFTLRAMGNLCALRPDALKGVTNPVADQLAEDITEFIELTLEHGKFLQKFQAALRALVFLIRRRSYQDGFLSVNSSAFERAISCCAKVYIAARLADEGRAWTAAAQARCVADFKADLKALRLPGREAVKGAHEATCRVIDDVDLSRVRMAGTKFPNNPTKLLALLVQVVEYIEGRGTGLLVIDDSEGDDDE